MRGQSVKDLRGDVDGVERRADREHRSKRRPRLRIPLRVRRGRSLVREVWDGRGRGRPSLVTPGSCPLVIERPRCYTIGTRPLCAFACRGSLSGRRTRPCQTFGRECASCHLGVARQNGQKRKDHSGDGSIRPALVSDADAQAAHHEGNAVRNAQARRSSLSLDPGIVAPQ